MGTTVEVWRPDAGRWDVVPLPSRWRKRTLAVFMFFVSLAAFGGGVAFAATASQPMHVSADEYSLWDGSRLFVAQGNVAVRYNRALITADTLQYDAEAGYAVFVGNVFYKDDEQELAGHSLHYDLNRGVAVIDDMEAVLYSEGVKGPMFVTGQRVRSSEGEVIMERATFTTCECEHDPPAYRFVAKELEIYPNDRVVVRGVTFYDHNVPLLYLPYLTLSLKEKTSRFDLPQIGYSERTGWFVKLTYNYVLKSGLYGALLFDYFQKLGPGGGVRHVYVDDESGTGTVYVYGAGDGFGGADASFAWERRWTGSPWDVHARYAYDVSGGPWGLTREDLTAGISLDRRTVGSEVLLDVEYRLLNRPPSSEPDTRLSASGSWRHRFDGGWEARVKGEAFDESAGGASRRWLGYAGEVQRSAPNYTLTARVEQQVNPDLKEPDQTGSLPWTHVSRMPEVQLRLRRINGFDIAFGAVRLKEEPWGTAAWRGEAEVALVTRTWRPSRSVSFHTSASARGRVYTTGDRQLTLQGRAGANVQLSSSLSATLQYNYRDAFGATPFRFDRVTAAQLVSSRLNWRSSGLTASLSASYNVLSERWSKLTFNGTWRAGSDVVVRASGAYDVYDNKLERVAGTVDWQPGEDAAVRLGAVYDLKKETWTTVHAELRLPVVGGWEAGVTAIYDFAKESFTRNHMYVSHNACGCREIRLRYDQVRGEVWLEYHITAFPSSRVAVGAGDDTLMFDADVLGDFLGN